MSMVRLPKDSSRLHAVASPLYVGIGLTRFFETPCRAVHYGKIPLRGNPIPHLGERLSKLVGLSFTASLNVSSILFYQSLEMVYRFCILCIRFIRRRVARTLRAT